MEINNNLFCKTRKLAICVERDIRDECKNILVGSTPLYTNQSISNKVKIITKNWMPREENIFTGASNIELGMMSVAGTALIMIIIVIVKMVKK